MKSRGVCFSLHLMNEESSLRVPAVADSWCVFDIS
jgi:hypothetical protein